MGVTSYDFHTEHVRFMIFQYIFKRKLFNPPASISDKYTDISDLRQQQAELEAQIAELKKSH